MLDEEEEEEEKKIGPHPDAATTLIFTSHQNNGITLCEQGSSLGGKPH